MIRRHVSPDGVVSEAVYSPCETYRYALTRRWAEGPGVLWIMLNPSTADERKNDPTIERCDRRSRAMGAGAYRIVNLFAYRATDPAALKRAEAPEGPRNARAVLGGCRWADRIICGWGVHGAHRGAGDRWTARLIKQGFALQTLGQTKDGHPRHPLYVSYAVSAAPWTAET